MEILLIVIKVLMGVFGVVITISLIIILLSGILTWDMGTLLSGSRPLTAAVYGCEEHNYETLVFSWNPKNPPRCPRCRKVLTRWKGDE